MSDETVYLIYHNHSTYNAGLVRITKSLSRARAWVEQNATENMQSMESDAEYYRNRYGAKGSMIGRWTKDPDGDGDDVYEYTDEGRITGGGDWLSNLGAYRIETFEGFDGQKAEGE